MAPSRINTKNPKDKLPCPYEDYTNRLLKKIYANGKLASDYEVLSPLERLEKTVNEEFNKVKRLTRILGPDAEVTDEPKK